MRESVDPGLRWLWLRELGAIERRKLALVQHVQVDARGFVVRIAEALPDRSDDPTGAADRDRARAADAAAQVWAERMATAVQQAVAEEAARLGAFAAALEVCGGRTGVSAALAELAQRSHAPQPRIHQWATALGAVRLSAALSQGKPLPPLPDPATSAQELVELSFLPLTAIVDRQLGADRA